MRENLNLPDRRGAWLAVFMGAVSTAALYGTAIVNKNPTMGAVTAFACMGCIIGILRLYHAAWKESALMLEDALRFKSLLKFVPHMALAGAAGAVGVYQLTQIREAGQVDLSQRIQVERTPDALTRYCYGPHGTPSADRWQPVDNGFVIDCRPALK